jgi:hypothetical protein
MDLPIRVIAIFEQKQLTRNYRVGNVNRQESLPAKGVRSQCCHMAVALILNPFPEFIEISGPGRFTRQEELEVIILSQENRPQAEQHQ